MLSAPAAHANEVVDPAVTDIQTLIESALRLDCRTTVAREYSGWGWSDRESTRQSALAGGYTPEEADRWAAAVATRVGECHAADRIADPAFSFVTNGRSSHYPRTATTLARSLISMPVGDFLRDARQAGSSR
ncbi:hypothetical protein [Corynebacterium mendelii]|uniref:hypothetical protein n=1 Tax=Corynebacterium mendelii TaxID=2765362 RepID=UPI00366C024E